MSPEIGGTIQIWDAETGKELKKIECPDKSDVTISMGRKERRSTNVSYVAFLSDGKRFVASTIGVGEISPNTRIFDSETGAVLQKFDGRAIAISADSTKMMVVIRENETRILQVLDVQSGRPSLTLRNPKERTHLDLAAFSPDGKYIAAADDYGKEVFIFETASGKLVNRWDAGMQVFSVSFSPDSKKIVMVVYGGALILDVASGKKVQEVGVFPTAFASAVYSPEGRRVAAGATALRVTEIRLLASESFAPPPEGGQPLVAFTSPNRQPSGGQGIWVGGPLGGESTITHPPTTSRGSPAPEVPAEGEAQKKEEKEEEKKEEEEEKEKKGCECTPVSCC